MVPLCSPSAARLRQGHDVLEYGFSVMMDVAVGLLPYSAIGHVLNMTAGKLLRHNLCSFRLESPGLMSTTTPFSNSSSEVVQMVGSLGGTQPVIMEPLWHKEVQQRVGLYFLSNNNWLHHQ
jgi:hypothetical protein